MLKVPLDPNQSNPQRKLNSQIHRQCYFHLNQNITWTCKINYKFDVKVANYIYMMYINAVQTVFVDSEKKCVTSLLKLL